MPTLYCMCGISGSGKSTWAAQHKQAYPDTIIVSTDEIREELFGSASIQAEPEKVFSIAYGRIEAYLLEGKDVVFDAMSLVRKYRLTLVHKYSKIARMVCVVTGADSARAIENQRKRDRQVPDEIVLAQSERFVKPNLGEGWKEIIYVGE